MTGKRAVLAAVILTFAAIVAVPAQNATRSTRGTAANNAAATQSNQQSNAANSSDNPFIQAMTPGETTPGTPQSELYQTGTVFLRLFLAVILSGILAFRPRKNVPLFRRSLFVSQTQILLAVVAAALMLIVGDNTARAFAIFAAVSLVRFRTNIRDPKEITVMLISLALGLAAGVGRWDLGVALCLFALALLWFLEFNESAQFVRSMELCVKTRNPDRTQEVLKSIFSRLKIDAEVRELVPADEEKPIGSITYYLNLRLNLTTDALSDRILAADPENTEGIQWSKTKSVSDIFQ